MLLNAANYLIHSTVVVSAFERRTTPRDRLAGGRQPFIASWDVASKFTSPVERNCNDEGSTHLTRLCQSNKQRKRLFKHNRSLAMKLH